MASPLLMSRNQRPKLPRRLRLILAIGALTGFAAAYRFALKYRERVGLPQRRSVEGSPADFGLDFETVEIPAGDHTLGGWFVPADSSAEPRPGVVVVHGWESNRGRTFAHVRYLHAAGFHCLVFDVRGHGDNPPETLPISVPEFADDTIAAVRWLGARPEVSGVGVVGHSMGAAGAIVAASREPAIGAVVSLSAPADPVRMTRITFDMAGMHVPEPIASPLAWFTAAILLVPRHHSVEEASASVAAARYRGPLLLVHGAQDHGVPVEHLELIGRAAAKTRTDGDAPVETLVLTEYGHRWLYEDAGCRRKIATFLAGALGGPIPPEAAGDRAAACVVERPPDPIYGFGPQAGTTPPQGRMISYN